MKSELLIVRDEQGAYLVSARSICALTSNYGQSQFTKWVESRIRTFFEGDDYRLVDGKSVNLDAMKGSKDYLVSIRAAQRIAQKDRSQALLTYLQEKESELTKTGAIAGAVQLPLTVSNVPKTGEKTSATSTDISLTDVQGLGSCLRARALFNRIALPHSKGVRDLFHDWFSSRVKKYDLTEGKDYIILPKSVVFEGSNRSTFDAWISVKTAKLFAKVQLAGHGKETLKVIEQLEEEAKPHHSPSTVSSKTELELPFSSEESTPDTKLTLDTAATTDFRQSDEATETVESEPAQAQDTTSAVDSASTTISPEPVTLPNTQPIAASLPLVPMPTLVSKSRLQQLMEQQQQVAQEIEQTLREEEEAKQKQVEVAPTSEAMADVHERLNIADQRISAMEQWVRSFIGFMQQGASLLAGELPVGIETAALDEQSTPPFQNADFSAEPVNIENELLYTPRRKLLQLVADYSQATTYPYNQVWCYLYEKLHSTYGFNVYRGKQTKERYIDFAERSNQLDNLLTIAQSTLQPAKHRAQA